MQPPAAPTSPDDPLYEAFYGFSEQPFAISTDPKFMFFSAPHRRAYEELSMGLRRDESLLLLTGETGVGKTTLCRAVIASLGNRTFSSVLHQPYMTGPEMLRLILRDFDLVSKEELRRGVLANADVPQLLDVIESFLRSLVTLESRAIVVIDEAQSLSPTLLDEVRMLTAFEQDGKRLVQIVLCGQPMLLTTLKTEPMYALNERITRRVALTPLSRDEVDAYIRHRISVAGGAEKVAFQLEAIRLVAELSRGLPRRVNVLCDRTLQEGRVDSARVVTVDHVKRAARSLSGQAPAPGAAEGPGRSIAGVPLSLGLDRRERRGWWKWITGGAVVAALAGGAGYASWANGALADSSMPEVTGPRRLQGPAPIAVPSEIELADFLAGR